MGWRPGLRRAAGRALSALGGGLPWAGALAAVPPDSAGPAATASTWAMAVVGAAVAVAVIVGAVLAWRFARSQRRLAEELRGARSEAQGLQELLDVWQWHSDAEHRVHTLRPPQGAPAGDWSAAPEAARVWEVFGAADEAALRAQLHCTAPLHDIEVQRQVPGTAPRRGLLRGRAVTDATGRFAGYRGTLRELPAAEPARPASHAPAGGLLSWPDTALLEPEHESISFTISHDLRAPIRVVEGFTRIVKEDYGRSLDRVGNEHLDRVLAAAARMNNMIDALLALSRLSSQPITRQPVNLSQLAGYVAEDLQRQWPDRDVALAIEPGMQVQGDPTLLRVVVENLLGNAWKYTGKAARPSIAFERHADSVDAFTVRDNGAGFDMRFSDRLFGVFQRLHSANDFPGTGVGLASVRRIVRRHGGEIWGEAELNRGARFHFSLPQAEVSVVPLPRAATPFELRSAGGGRHQALDGFEHACRLLAEGEIFIGREPLQPFGGRGTRH